MPPQLGEPLSERHELFFVGFHINPFVRWAAAITRDGGGHNRGLTAETVGDTLRATMLAAADLEVQVDPTF